jgi:hypothetical protein
MKVDEWYRWCAEVFNFDEQIIDPAKGTNDWLGGLSLDTSQIFFVNAGEDPWQWAGQTDSDAAEARQQKAYVMDCTDCGHCKDLHGNDPSDPAEVTKARKDVHDAM